MLFERLARASLEIAGTRSRLHKIEIVASCLAELAPDEVPVAVAHLAGELPQGTIGVGWASLRSLPEPAGKATLQVADVDAALTRIGETAGKGSQAARRAEIAGLFGRATQVERDFLVGLLLGELRQGALEGVMVEAIGRAAAVPASSVRRALMVAGALGVVARAALSEGEAGLGRFRLNVLHAFKPMLAQSAADIDDALARISPAGVEWKLDGARLQIHRLDDEVRAFTRNLADVTDRIPEIVDAVRALPNHALILDGEAIALRTDGRPFPFQGTMSRFGSRLDVAKAMAEVPLSAFFFDCLHIDGEDVLDRPGGERAEVLAAALPEDLLVRRSVTEDVAAARAFLDEAISAGHEGVMVKSLDAPYEAGRRGAGWLKVKRAHTLDLVVLAAEWGHGRRHGWLSNLHLGARDPSGGYVMLGKTFKGMTDEMLAWQTERLLELETGRTGIVVHVHPELVVEVAFDGLQASSRYPGGLALRFARIKGYRPDKGPDEADSIETVRALFEGGATSSGG